MIEFDEEVKWILGRPCFMCGPIAKKLRGLGHKIRSRAEEEQAMVIYWMLCLYEKHGKEWRQKATEELEKSI